MAWILRLVKIDAEGVEQDTDVMEINLPHDLGALAPPCASPLANQDAIHEQEATPAVAAQGR